MATGQFTSADVDAKGPQKGQFTAADVDAGASSKQEGTPAAAPAGPAMVTDSSGTQMPSDVYARHQRALAGTVKSGALSPQDVQAGAQPDIGTNWNSDASLTDKFKGSAYGAVDRAVTGASGLAKTIMLPKGKTEMERLHDIWNNIISTPLHEQAAKADATTGIESVGHRLASYVPVVGPMGAAAGETLGSGDPGGGLDAMLAVEGAKAPFKKAAISDAAAALDKMKSINDGKVRVVNGMVRGPLTMLKGKVNAEIGASVNNVLQADTMDNLQKGTQAGQVNTLDAAKAAQAKLDAIGSMDKFPDSIAQNKIMEAQLGAHTLQSAKALLTDTQQQAAKLSQAGRAREASVMWSLANGLADATQARAEELGGGKEWAHYKNETTALKQHEGGLMGTLMGADHATALRALINPDNQAEAGELTKFMGKYGLDTSTFTKAQEMAKQLEEHTQQTKNLFQGKIRAIMKYPVAAGSAAAGASIVGHASGIPGMGFVLPLIVAGKVAGILDNKAVVGLLKEAKRVTGEGDQNIHAQPEGPIARAQLGGGGGAPVPPPTQPPKVSTDSMGIRWAESPDGYRVSIPKRIPDEGISDYAGPKLEEQARIHGGIKAAKTGTANDRPQVQYKPSEKAATMSEDRRSLGPEWEAGEASHELEQAKSIQRNPKATDEDRTVAASRIKDIQDMMQRRKK